jgi:hypothetical protein
VAALLVIAALMAAPAADSRPRAVLVPMSTAPLKVKGTHFASRERVRVRVGLGERTLSRSVRAGRSGSFVINFPGVEACNGVTGVATGSRGSHASFQFSSFAC